MNSLNVMRDFYSNFSPISGDRHHSRSFQDFNPHYGLVRIRRKFLLEDKNNNKKTKKKKRKVTLILLHDRPATLLPRQIPYNLSSFNIYHIRCHYMQFRNGSPTVNINPYRIVERLSNDQNETLSV